MVTNADKRKMVYFEDDTKINGLLRGVKNGQACIYVTQTHCVWVDANKVHVKADAPSGTPGGA
jgi:hypothetical protein